MKPHLWVVEVNEYAKGKPEWIPIDITASSTRWRSREQRDRMKRKTPDTRFRIRKYVREE